MMGAHKKHLAIGCSDNIAYLYEKNVNNGLFELSRKFEDAMDDCLSVSFDESGNYLAVGSREGTVRIYQQPTQSSHSSESSKNVIVQKIENSQIGLGIFIGILIGLAVSGILFLIYFKLIKKKDESMKDEMISENQFH